MEDGIQKINPINPGMEIKISGEKRVKHRKISGNRKTDKFMEVFRKKTEKGEEKEAKITHVKYKNGRMIK